MTLARDPKVAVLTKAGYPKVAVLLTGKGYKRWFPVHRVLFNLHGSESAIDSCPLSRKLEIYSLLMQILPHSSTITSLITS